MRHLCLAVVLALLLLASCSSDSKNASNDALPTDATADGASGDVTDPGLEPGPYAYPAPELELHAFTVVVATSTTSVAVGQKVEISARAGRGEATGVLTFEWQLDGAEGFDGSGPTGEVTFGTAGRYAVAVVATDGGGPRPGDAGN